MDERLKQLAQGIDEWLVGDWIFKTDRDNEGCSACIEEIYIYLSGSMGAKEAEQTALYLVIKGVYDGKTYKQITEESAGHKTSA